MEKSFKLTGYGCVIDYSFDGKYILIGDYDGGFKLYDVEKNTLHFKMPKLKGPKNDIEIRNIGISPDNKYAAFSALWKVFVLDAAQKKIIWEYEYSRAERMTSRPFCFFHHTPRLLIADGDSLLLHDIETNQSRRITLPEGAGWTDCIAISPDDTRIAYKSCNGPHDIRLDRQGNVLPKNDENNNVLDDKVFLYDTATGALLKILNVPYQNINGHQISLSGNMGFPDGKTLLILRKALGLTWFDLASGKELFTRTWEDMQFFSAKAEYRDRDLKLSTCSRYILFNKLAPVPDPARPPEQWGYRLPDCYEYVLYDSKENEVLYRAKLGEAPASFHITTKQFAYIKTERDEAYHATRYLVSGEIPI
jgi:WD40 repeat protein